MQEEKLTAQQLKARLRSLKYRQRSMGPRKQVVTDIPLRLNEHRMSAQPISADEYEVLSPARALSALLLRCCAPERATRARADRGATVCRTSSARSR